MVNYLSNHHCSYRGCNRGNLQSRHGGVCADHQVTCTRSGHLEVHMKGTDCQKCADQTRRDEKKAKKEAEKRKAEEQKEKEAKAAKDKARSERKPKHNKHNKKDEDREGAPRLERR
ncbi:hypothetical protein CLAFUW4_11436 [Fulvia fulva]|uniref:Uncharacterized protein n=1 Tax=Passalora fulva TaxID=5499 RepID=A0A9Q8URL2_PASFU|nr:uncharacterized protein CLAFUR5_10477 [Fulvia fulva]KAK4619487.1 hypothetical protein CLAFUR4_11442 [Fulvia fulva]KAK4620693.1 hypothetical protein CLAFUR0_11448 [Fulvia fulva]UJO19868.1 hypothetical protein CLAFUR5_10477 [Fulvia fulva]WPV17662.1 hypothetical protein CLAFUW4_11436 [Fulvia fulva]WPV32030.1 hypothetical protein CLAFUW7_11432 [Fulvia fulva]